MVEFSDFIEDMELIDLQLEGDPNTWFKGDNHTTASRIDRFLISEKWDDSFRNIKQTLQQRLISDHVPVALCCGAWEQAKSYFKFENWWLISEGFDVTQQSRALTEEESVRKAAILMEFEDHLKNEESAWRQKSRALWLKEGYRNTKFFHRTANAYKRCNNIDQLVIQDETVEEPNKIKNEIIEFYKKLYTEPEEWRPAANFENCPIISELEKESLQSKFEEQEVLSCLKMCASDKAPGPDGYTMTFSLSDILKQVITEAFNNFHSQEMFEKSFNATYIALIPKKTGAQELRDFRPISLIESFYKLLSKVLTERLKRVVGKLVDAQQMAFIKGRQIMDAVLIANEAVDSRIKKKKSGILCKLDIEKAYDHVNWSFLLKMVEQMGFGQKWINWMKFCISTVRFSILTNGSLEGFFPTHRGLRQGDSLSPFLFIIAMEGLNNMIKAPKVNGWVKGFEVDRNGSNSLEITHLQYTDDTLVFCDAEEEQLRFLRIILVLFEGISGLHINRRKTHIFPINEVYKMDQLTLVLGGDVGSLPTIYLGMPLGARSKSKEIWNLVIKKSDKKLSRELWPTMKSHTFIRMNNGRKTSFWNDNWLGHGCLKELYPDMFGLAQNQQKTVAEMWSSQGLLKFFLVGKKLELKQLTEIDVGLSQHVSGGQFGRKEMLDVLKTEATQCRRSNSIVTWFKRHSRKCVCTTATMRVLHVYLFDIQGQPIISLAFLFDGFYFGASEDSGNIWSLALSLGMITAHRLCMCPRTFDNILLLKRSLRAMVKLSQYDL
ncbi:uncharacterized protein LOC142181712 [Nicotiana tabacum]|uniref:Uncharacterized protein LOC142181712 n=1 Tax=Nicotiana tabacum TaxID=4097 RepID=A0AC58UP43_TOBAC